MVDAHWGRKARYSVTVQGRTWQSSSCFFLRLSRPEHFQFVSGQKVLLETGGCVREYSIASAEHNQLLFCIKLVHGGRMTERLAKMKEGEALSMSEAYGYFVYRQGSPVLVATGTGVAPFAAYVEAGLRNFILLHGVSSEEELYFREILEPASELYVPCISTTRRFEKEKNIYMGRVTDYLREHLPRQIYDFYLCGNGEMLVEAMGIIDKHYPNSRIYSEKFFN